MPTVVKPIHPATTSQPPSTPSWSPVVRRRYRVRASVRMMTCRSGNTRNKPLFRRSAHPPASSVMRAPPVEYDGSERACPPCPSFSNIPPGARPLAFAAIIGKVLPLSRRYKKRHPHMSDQTHGLPMSILHWFDLEDLDDRQ